MSATLKIPSHPALNRDISVTRVRLTANAPYIIADFQSGRNLRISKDAYLIASLFDGKNSVDEIVVIAGEKHGLAATMVRSVLQSLAGAGMLQGVEMPADAEKDNNDKPSRLREGAIEKMAMSSRHPLGDIRSLLEQLSPVCRLAFSYAGFAIWSALVVYALWQFMGQSGDIVSPLTWLSQMSLVEASGLTLAIIFAKFAHEFGHAAALQQMARAEGVDAGVIHVGITRFFFFPLPYTDATAAWRIASRMRRVTVALAGAYVEVFLAAIAIALWAIQSNPIIDGILLQFAIISAISTLFFNLNPLIKLDGYYVLTDLLNIQNLAPRANKALSAWSKQILFGEEPTHPAAKGLVAFGIASAAYRVFISIGIATVAGTISPVLAIAIMTIAASAIVVRPTIKMLREIEELTLSRAAKIAAGLFVCVSLFPIHQHVSAPGIVETTTMEKAIAPAGSTVVAATFAHANNETIPSIEYANPELELEEKALNARRAAAKIRLRQAAKINTPDTIRLAEDVVAIDGALGRLAKEKARLKFAAHSLTAITNVRDAKFYQGQTVSANHPLGVTYSPDALSVRAILDQRDTRRLNARQNLHEARVWRDRTLTALPATITNASFDPINILPSPALSRGGGGAIIVSPTSDTGLAPATPHFGALVNLNDEIDTPTAENLRPGEIVTVQFRLSRRPLIFLVTTYVTERVTRILGVQE